MPFDLAAYRRSHPRVCGGCGYPLTGLGKAGRCPECGLEYNLAEGGGYSPRPPFGYLQLAVPTAVVLIAYQFVFPAWIPISALLFLFLAIVCILSACVVSIRLAEWRYSVALARSVETPIRVSRGQFILMYSGIFLGVQVLVFLLSAKLLGVIH